MPDNTTPVFEELGFYALAGQPESAHDLIDEVRTGEAMGFGTVWLSERYNGKEAATLAGAAAAVSERIRIATGVTNHNTRHPMVTAGHAVTMHQLTGGRYLLGLGTGVRVIQDVHGIPHVRLAEIEDFAGIVRRLFRGEAVVGHHGPAGSWPVLYLDRSLDAHLPMALAAFGPKAQALGGRCFDAVLLHTFFSDAVTARAVRTVKEAAERAGRNPDDVHVVSCLATVGDHVPEPLRLKKTVGRLATYLQGYGDLLVATNGWDPTVLARFRADATVASFAGAIDAHATAEQLEHVATLLPPEWLTPAATGTPARCVDAVEHQLALGCAHVILHGASPRELEPIVAEYRARRAPSPDAAGAADALASRPGRPSARDRDPEN